MRILRHKLNNNGSTLLIVIICLAFIGILGSLMLSVSATNLRMKMIESKSKVNFYSCEIAMEEVRVGIQELTTKIITDIYKTEILPKYTTYNPNTLNTTIQSEVVAALKLNLAETSNLTLTDISKITQYLSVAPADSTREVTVGSLIYDSNSITIKKLTINYEYKGYKTTISSDLRINIPKFTITQAEQPTEQYQITQPFANYVLIADGGIRSGSTTDIINLAGKTNIYGSVYAGEGGITITNRIGSQDELKIDGKNIVTRGDITLVNTGKLTIGETTMPILWADNIVTKTTNLYSQKSALKTTMNINGICIIKDDLILDGRNSDVTLQSGAYIGYTGKDTSEGSAIIINGSGSSLNLTGLSKLILAGRAYVSVEDSGLNKDTDIQTGESLAFKSNQRAYLIPGQLIGGILHNPITQEDIDKIMGAPVINFAGTGLSSDINYNSYVAPTEKYKIASKQTGLVGVASTLSYYYLNFGSGKQADEFLKEFITKKPNELKLMEQFTLGSVTLPAASGSINAVGNVMSYNGEVQRTDGMSFNPTYTKATAKASDEALDSAVAALSLSEPIYTNTGLKDLKVSMLKDLYYKITHVLSINDTTTVYNEEDKVVDTYLIAGGIANVVAGDDVPINADNFDYIKSETDFNIATNTPNLKQSFVVIKGDVSIADGNKFNGFLIASGNITIGAGAQVKGLIISVGENGKLGDVTIGDNVTVEGRIVAGNDIILGKNCTIKTDTAELNPEIETYISNIFILQGNILNKLIKNTDKPISFPGTSTSSVSVDLSNMISYENWKKE